VRRPPVKPVASPRATTRGPPAPRCGRGRAAKRLRRDETHRPVSVKTLAMELAADAWQQITPAFAGAGLADGSNTPLASRFARRGPPGARRRKRNEPAAEEWLLIEWPEGATEPDHYWLSRRMPAGHLVRVPGRSDQSYAGGSKRDYLELKQEVGLRPLRRPRMARLSPSRKSLRCGLRIPGLRKGDDSPLRTFSRLARPATCRSRRLSTQRCCRCVRSDTCQTPSPRCVSASHAPWFTSCLDAPAAAGRGSGRSSRLSDVVGVRRGGQK